MITSTRRPHYYFTSSRVAATMTLLAFVLLISSSLLSVIRAFAPSYSLTRSQTSRTTTSFVNRPSLLDTSSLTCLEMQKKKGKKGSSAFGGKGFGSGSSAAAATTTTARKNSSSSGGGGGGMMGGFKYAGSVRPGRQSAQKTVTVPGIVKPDYWKTGVPGSSGGSGASAFQLPWMIEVKSAEDIEKMKAAGSLARDILDLAGRHVQEGVTTDEIDQVVHQATVEAGAYPSPLNYRGFPKSCCTSVNEVICHGIPDDRKLECGDVINIDITVHLNGFHGDCSEMFVVTPYKHHHKDDDKTQLMAQHAKEVLDEAGQALLQTTYDCWISACQFVKPGNDYKDIGAIIEDYVVPRGFSTVRNFCGHGIGQTFHTNPNILHYRNSEPNGQMAHGHTFTIEPMICEGSARALTWPDNWTATTVDGKRSAQFEHTLLVTSEGKGGVQALTGKKESSPVQFWELESKVHSGIWLGTSPEAVKRAEEINQKLKSQ